MKISTVVAIGALWVAGLSTGGMFAALGNSSPQSAEPQAVTPSQPGEAKAAPVIKREPWSPTYRAAREAGYDPTMSQHFSTLCKAGEEQGDNRLCIKPGMDKAAQLAHLSNMVKAARIVMAGANNE